MARQPRPCRGCQQTYTPTRPDQPLCVTCRKPPPRTCPGCDRSFVPSQRTQRWCTPVCRASYEWSAVWSHGGFVPADKDPLGEVPPDLPDLLGL